MGKEIKKKESSFHIVGKAVVNDYTFDIDKQSENNKSYIYSTMNLKVSTGSGNEVFTTSMGGYDKADPRNIYVVGKNKDGNADFENKFQVEWDDRLDEDIIKTVANMNLFTAGLEKDENDKTIYKDFLSEYDFISYVQEHLTNEMVVSVSGKLEFSPYNDSVSRKKIINKIILKDAKEEEFYAVAKQRVLVDADSVGEKDVDKNTIPLTVYVADYLYKYKGAEIKQQILFEQTIDLPLDKYGDKINKIIKAYFTPKKNNGVVWIGLVCDIIEGAESSISSIDDLPEDLKEMYELGMIDEDEALARCTTGNKERRLVFKNVITKKMKDANDDETIVVARDYDEYTVDDYVFLGDVYSENGSASKKEAVNIDDDEDLNDLLDELDIDLDLD